MIKIPSQSTRKHTVATSSDLFGTIHYGKNINLDEEGYIKLSSRTVSIFNEGDVPNLRLATAFGRGALFTNPEISVDFAITQAGQKGYWLTLLANGNTLNVDVGTGVPTLTSDSHATWYKNLWTVTSDTDFWTKAGISDNETYTDRGNLTTGKVHFVEKFSSRNTVCITNGNVVSQFDSTYSASVDLTLPTDFETIALAYSNYSMGVIAMFSDTTTGKNQNQDAYFFVWDGASSSASQGVPIGSDKPIAIKAYMGSWIILTRTGQVKFFNGGGWKDLTALPIYYSNLLWGTSYTRDILGDAMSAEGDSVYMNVNGFLQPYGKKYEQFLNTMPGGILCYDPEAKGVYNRYSPSISPANVITVTSGNINTTTDVLTKTAGTLPSTGSPIKYIFDKNSQIGGLSTPVVYYIIKLNSTTFQLATTKANAIAGTAIDITSTGATNNYFFGLEVYDYGASYANTSGAIAQVGALHPMYDHLIYSAELNDWASTGNLNHLLVTCPDFPNRGYFVTPKIQSEGVKDTGQRVYVKYRTLDTTDSIIVKVKDADILGLPISTPQARTSAVNQCVWTGTDAFTTTADLSDAKTALDAGKELECEVIAGAGAGTMTKITGINYDTGTYAVVLSEAVDGAAASRFCDILIENWRYLGTITSDDKEGFKSWNIGGDSTWYKFKVELRGVETTVEEVTFVNKENKPFA